MESIGRSNLKPELRVAIRSCCCREAPGRTHLDASAWMTIAGVQQISPPRLCSISYYSGDRRECINVPKRAKVPERNVSLVFILRVLHSTGLGGSGVEASCTGSSFSATDFLALEQTPEGVRQGHGETQRSSPRLGKPPLSGPPEAMSVPSRRVSKVVRCAC